jgi:hypothetical protein
MKKQDYSTSFLAKKNAKDVLNAINHVSGWWTENVEGSSGNLNDIFTVRFAETFVTFRITEFIPEKKAAWLVTDCYLHWLTDKKEWMDTQILFEISEQGDSTRVNFTHVGLVPEIECYNDCVKGWDQYIKNSLYKLVTEGKGQPERKKMEAAGTHT